MRFLSDYMIKDHKEFEKVFNDFGDNIGSSHLMEYFLKFKWNLTAHLAVEEKIIFINYNPETEEDAGMMEKILEEHRELISLMDDIEDRLNDGKDVDISHLKRMLIEHRNFEDEVLYPMLDNKIDENTKKQIITKLENQ